MAIRKFSLARFASKAVLALTEIRAYVVADKSEISGQQIMDWVASKVSAHKRLRGGVVFLDSIPKSPAGKILRKVLRDKAQKEVQARL